MLPLADKYYIHTPLAPVADAPLARPIYNIQYILL
nr:MAG TPA: hypothetical protein [Caudoviricetes sp.]